MRNVFKILLANREDNRAPGELTPAGKNVDNIKTDLTANCKPEAGSR
jgi:hypothetical protein